LSGESDRPFGQRKYPEAHLKPTFSGYHYKFTLLLPISERTIGEDISIKTVFTQEDLNELRRLFRDDFGGSTVSRNTTGGEGTESLWKGEWRDTETQKTVVNEHARYEIYSRREPDAIQYFTELKARLLIWSKKERNAEQKDIVVEVIEVSFITNVAPSSTDWLGLAE
jgi:hypothetical protein